jgi:hypothetical protein
VSKSQKRALDLIKVFVSATLIAGSGKSHLKRSAVSSDKVILSSDLLFDQFRVYKGLGSNDDDNHGTFLGIRLAIGGAL